MNLKKYCIMIIAAVLLVGGAFAGAASADPTDISTFKELENLMKTGGEGVLVNDIIIGPGNSSNVMRDVTLDLNGHKLILGAETSSEPLDATISVWNSGSFNLTNSANVGTVGTGGFYNNGHLISYGDVDVSSIKWNIYPAPKTSFTSDDRGGIIYGLSGTFSIGAYGSLKLSESHDKSPNLIMAANDKMLGSSEAGAKFIIVMNDVDKTYVAQKDDGKLGWVVEGIEPALKVTGICNDPYMGTLRGTEYSEFAEEIKGAWELVMKMEPGTATIKLMKDLELEETFVIADTGVTLDLNGKLLTTKDKSTILKIVTDQPVNITDSNPTTEHIFKFVPVEPWTLVEKPTREQRNLAVPVDEFSIADALTADSYGMEYYVNVPGGILYGGIGYDAGGIACGKDVNVSMYAGSIVGCRGVSGAPGAIHIAECEHSEGFKMLGGTIAGCRGDEAGAVRLPKIAMPLFTMSGNARIIGCYGGGASAVFIPGGFAENFKAKMEMGGNAVISDCYGSGDAAVQLMGFSQFNVSGNAKVINNIAGTDIANYVNINVQHPKILTLTGPFTGLIGIKDTASIPFGSAVSGATGAENFVMDNAQPAVVGMLKGDEAPYDLVWTEGRIVTFDPNNDEKSWVKPVVFDTAVTKPENPTMKGYDFAGWYDGDEKWDFKTPVMDDLTLTADWTKIPLPSSSSNSNGGATVILTDASTPVSTVAPTISPTSKPTTSVPTISPATAKPTAQPTQKSPAPLAGLIAGLGAVALLIRMRR